MAAQRFVVQIVVDAVNKAGPSLKAFQKGFRDALQIPRSMEDAFKRLGNTVGNFTAQLPRIAVEAVKLGAQVEASSLRFDRFAGSADRAEELLQAFQQATLGTVDRMGAMSSAGRLLQMGLVSTADEMGQVARIATMLGDQTLGTTDRMADFAALLANQSIPRLDNFGISSGRVRTRIQELQAASADMTREQAFQTAVLEEGEKALDRLGDTSELASVKISRLQASWKTLGQVIAESSAEVATGNRLWRVTANVLDVVSQRTADVNKGLARAQELGVVPRIFAEAYADASAAARLFQGDEDELRATLEEATEATKEAEREIRRLAAATREGSGANFDYGDSTDDAESGLLDLEGGLQNVSAAYQKQAREARMAATAAILAAKDQARQVRALAVEASADFTAFDQSRMRSAEDLADDREKVEEKHADELAKIQARGRSRAIRFDALAEQEKLDNLKFKLDQALLQQTEFTDKTRQSVRNAKDFQIANLRDEIGEREQMFADFEAGRLVKAGENIGGLLVQEEERHAESLRLLQEAEEEQELAKLQSLGRNVLANITAWASNNDVAQEQITEAQH